jgi:YqjK-like protein
MTDRERAIELEQRRELLVARAAAQRLQLARAIEPLEPTLAWADRAWRVWRYAREHPLLQVMTALTAAAALVRVRPRRAWRAFSLGLAIWRVVVGWRRTAAMKRGGVQSHAASRR